MEHAVKQSITTVSSKKQERFFGKTNEQPFFSPTFLQPKLTIGPVDDPYEREADSVADKVMRMSDQETLQAKPSPMSIQRKCAACEEQEKLQKKEEDEERPLQLKAANELNISQKCAHCEEEEKKIQMKGANGSSGGMTAPSIVHDVINSSGQPLDPRTRSFMESRFGYDFGNVQVHNDSLAHQSTADINALAYTHGNHVVFGSGKYQPNTNSGKELLAHELTHVVQQNKATNAIGTAIQREMKFEFQTKNEVWRNDGASSSKLDRKYGPEDYLAKGSTGVRLESETNGVLEFETEWFRKWSKLEAQIDEAFQMTKDMNSASAAADPSRKQFPFNVDNLRTGTKSELKKGVWKAREGYEGSGEKILKSGENLEVNVKDSNWNAGIQSSEGFLLQQFESFLKEHEFSDYNAPVITSAQDVLTTANTTGIPAADLVNLLNFLEIIVNYVLRGEGGSKSASAGAFSDVSGMPSKQAFTLMNRTDFASIYITLLSPKEKILFKKIVNEKILLKKMGLTTKSPFFVKGYGTHTHYAGPTVHQWLYGIYNGYDLLSIHSGKGLSAAMGKYNVETKKGKKDTGLVKFETRNTILGAFKDAKDWKTYAEDLFLEAATCRARGGTSADLNYDGSKKFTGTCP